jgi:predicted nucleotidyltransferase
MKKTIVMFMLFIQCCTISYAGEAQKVYEKAMKTGNKVFTANWAYEFQDQDNLFGIFADIDMTDKDNANKRYNRMLHIPYLNSGLIKKMTGRVSDFAENVPEITSFIEREISKRFFHQVTVQHISIYGSYLYNEIDPDDVDLLIVVDSPITLCEHLEFPASMILEDKGARLPTMSFQIMDYNTYLFAKVNTKNPFANLPRGEKLALQHLTVVASWYYTIYGFDLRYENAKSLKSYMKLNYLNKAFNTLNAAGARLYKSALSALPNETDLVRLRKVVSRILITDYIVTVLNKQYANSPKSYDQLYKEIRTIKEGDFSKIGALTIKIEKLYLKKLSQLLELAEKYKKLDYLDSKSY